MVNFISLLYYTRTHSNNIILFIVTLFISHSILYSIVLGNLRNC